MTLARWQNSIEQIMLAAVGPQERILGLTSLRPGAGVSLVCHHIARTAAAGEFKTLLLDISEPHTVDGPVRTWRPGHDKISNLITPTVGRYDYLKIRTDEATRPLFCNPAKLRSVYRTELEQYALVVVDLPPLLEPSELGPNPVAAAGSCDQVLLLCAVGRDTRSELADAISLVGGAGGKLAGLVSNEYLYEQPLEQIGRLAGLLRVVPRVARAPLVACRWIGMWVATVIASASAKLVADAKALLRAAYWVARLPVLALRWIATCVAAAGSWMWAKLVDAAKRLLRATLWLALLPVRAMHWIATCVAAAGSWTWAKLVGATKHLLRATQWVALLPVRAMRWIASCVAAAGSWTWAKLVDVAKRLLRATLWLALLPVRAMRWIASCVAAAGSWTWAKLVGATKHLLRATQWVALLPVRAMRWITTRVGMTVSWLSSQVAAAAKALLRVVYWVARLPVLALRGIASCVAAAGSWTWGKLVDAAKRLLRGTRWLALLPVRAMRWIATRVGMTVSWFSSQVAAAAKAPLRVVGWLARLPLVALRWMATCVGTATSWTAMKLVLAATYSLRAARWAGYQPVAALLWIANCMRRTASWTAAKLVYIAKALLAAARWLVHLPVAACRLFKASLLATATKISDASLRFGRGAFRTARHLWNLPSRVMELLSRAAEWLHQSLAPDAGHRNVRGLQKAGVLSAFLGGAALVAIAALDPLGWTAEKGNRQPDASLTDARPPMLKTAALDVGSYRGGLSAIDVPAVSGLPASRTDGPPAIRAHTVAIDAPPAAQPDRSGQQEPAAAAPAEPAPRTVPRDRDDRLHRTSDSPPAPLPNTMAPVDTTSTPPPREPNDQQREHTAEPRATVVVAEATPTTGTPRLSEARTGLAHVPAAGLQARTETDQPPASTPIVAGAPLLEPSAQQADHTSQPLANAGAPPTSAADASPVLSSAHSEPTSGQTGRPLAPVASIVVAVGPASSPATVATPLDSSSFAPLAAQVDRMPQPTAPSAENLVVVAPEVNPAAASPAVGASHASPSAHPASAQSGQAVAAPLTIAAAGSDAPSATVATPPDSSSFSPPAAQVDQQAYPAPQAMTQPAANAAAVVPPEAPPAISPPRLTGRGAQTDSPAPARIPTLSSKERERAEQMVARGERDLADGNVAQARLFFLNAAKAGLPRGALLLAATYDPRELARPSILGVQPNIALARQWYERARELGATEAAERLGGLVGR